MTRLHAKLSASGAKKWLNCPLSVSMESQFPDSDSTYSTEGTTAHELGEAKIRLELKEITKTKYSKILKILKNVDEEMQEFTEDYKNYVIERYNKAKSETPDALIEIEKRIDFSEYAKDGFGTGDAVIITDGYVEIIDFKYGKGVRVSAEDNPQLRLYALGVIEEYSILYDIKEVYMTIYQPRVGNISDEIMTAYDLLKWGRDCVIPRADDAYNDVNLCFAGVHCDEGFCKARPICREYTKIKLEITKYEYKDVRSLSVDEVAEVLNQVDGIGKWIKLVKDYAYNQALNHGVIYPGYKLVEGKSSRVYRDIDEVANNLKEKGYTEDEIYEKKLKAITTMEKFIGKKRFETLLADNIIIQQGSPTLVPESDKRKELGATSSAIEDFKNIIIVD